MFWVIIFLDNNSISKVLWIFHLALSCEMRKRKGCEMQTQDIHDFMHVFFDLKRFQKIIHYFLREPFKFRSFSNIFKIIFQTYSARNFLNSTILCSGFVHALNQCINVCISLNFLCSHLHLGSACCFLSSQISVISIKSLSNNKINRSAIFAII